MQPLFTGSGVALVTPFGDGDVAVPVLRELVEFQLRSGTNALVVNGSTGEAATMSAAEQRRSADAVVSAAAGQVPVIVGVGGSDTAGVVELAKGARAAGADGLLLSAPPYSKPPRRGIVAHYRAVLDAADLPLIVYNVPGRTASNIDPEAIEEIASDPRVVGVKEASGDLSQMTELARRLSHRVALYSGNDDQVIPMLALGGKGVISVLANIAPAAVARLVHLFLGGDVEGARAIQFEYLPLIRALFRESNPIPVKTAVTHLGFNVGDVRLPLVAASSETRRELVACMLERGLLAGEPARV